MVIRTSAHTHTTFVDGKQTPEEVARAAHEMGFESLGFSEHGQQPFDPTYGMSAASERRYIEEVRRVAAAYDGRMKVWLGVERDQYGLSNREDFDYVIGSKHYFLAGDGQFAGDGPYEEVAGCCQRFFGGDWIAMCVKYFAELAGYVADYKPDVIGHLDLLTKHNEGGRVFDEGDAEYRRAALDAVERMAETGAILEINTGAIARGYRTKPYPAAFLLKRWKALGGRVMVNGDCHNAPDLLKGYDVADALLDEVGYRTVWTLGTSKELFVERTR